MEPRSRASHQQNLLVSVGALVSFSLIALDLGLNNYGVPYDEAMYQQAARRHITWLAAFSDPGNFSSETLRAHFAWHPEVVQHPTFSRWLSGASWRIFHGALGVDELVAFRLHNALAYALVALGIAGTCARRWGLPVGAAALLFFWSDVRFYGHAHTAMADLVLSCTWLWAVLLLLRGIEQPRRLAVAAAAVLAGLALATKLTGIALVGLLAIWPLLARGWRAWPQTLMLSSVPPLVFIALNPQSWHEPLGWWHHFVTEFSSREHVNFIPTLFLGQRYGHRVPWYVPSVHALVTTPPTVLLLALFAAVRGTCRLVRADVSERMHWLRGPWPLLLAAGFSTLLLASLPAVPAHDLERLFLPLQPFLVIYAAYGFHLLLELRPVRRALRGPQRSAVRALAILALSALCVLPLIEAVRQHPYPLTYFNFLTGGMRGAEARGFDVAYLKLEANQELLDALNERLPSGATLYATFLNLDLIDHQRAGRLRADLRVVRDPRADFAILYNRRGWMTLFEARVWDGAQAPLWRMSHRGVDLMRLYRAPLGKTPPNTTRESGA